MEFGDFPLDPDLKVVLEHDAAFLAKRGFDSACDAIRLKINEELGLIWNAEYPPVKTVHSMVVRIDGRPLELRTFLPEQDSGNAYIIWIHGGGWNEGSLDLYDRLMRVLANAAACPVIGVGYTKVPMARFPAQIEELVFAYRYIDESLFPQRPCKLVGGYSAGANLIMSSMVMYENTLGPSYFHSACLVCGLFDWDLSSASHIRYDGFFGNSRTRLKTIIENYAPGAIGRRDPKVFPVDCSQSVCERFLIVSAEHDMLRDDSHRLAMNMKLQGKETTYLCVPRMSHIFVQRSMGIPAADRVLDGIGAHFRQQSNGQASRTCKGTGEPSRPEAPEGECEMDVANG